MNTAVHMIIKALCKLVNNALLLCIALIWCLSKLPSPCSNIRFSCTPCVFYCPQLAATRDYSGQHAVATLVTNAKCQNNKCFFAVNYKIVVETTFWMFLPIVSQEINAIIISLMWLQHHPHSYIIRGQNYSVIMRSAIAALALVKFIHKSVPISLDPWSMCWYCSDWHYWRE